MTLLHMLRPADTFSRGNLTTDEQTTLLELARRAGDTATRRMLASHPQLGGEARLQLIGDRSQDIRKRILNRADLTTDELESLLVNENRTTVLAALAQKADSSTLQRLVNAAKAKNSLTLAEALLTRGALDQQQRLAVIHLLADNNREFGRLTSAGMRAVTPCAGDPKTLAWAAKTSGYNGGWEFTPLIGKAAEATRDVSTLNNILSALAGVGEWDRVEQYLSHTLERERKALASASKDARYSTDELLTLAGTLPAELASAGAPASTIDLARNLSSSIQLLLGHREEPSAPDESAGDYATIDAAKVVVRTEAGLDELSREALAELACNPNHVSDTIWMLCRELRARKGIAVELLSRHQRIASDVWETLRGDREGDGSSARDVLDQLGHDTLIAALNSPAFKQPERGRYYWRTQHPLLGHTSTLSWVLADGPTDELDQVALDLPVRESVGAETTAFQLLHRHIDDNANLWDAVNSLATNWEGTFRDLLTTAAGTL